MAGKVKENRVRRMAERQGLSLSRSRRRDRLATDYGGYMLADARTGSTVAGGHPFAFSLSLDEAEAWLKTPPEDRPRDPALDAEHQPRLILERRT